MPLGELNLPGVAPKVVFYVNVPHPAPLAVLASVKNLGLPPPPPPASHANGLPYGTVNTMGPPVPSRESWLFYINSPSRKR